MNHYLSSVAQVQSELNGNARVGDDDGAMSPKIPLYLAAGRDLYSRLMRFALTG